MKFSDRYQRFLEERKEEVPVIQLRHFEAVLNNCVIIKETRLKDTSNEEFNCPGCDGRFFSSINKDMHLIVNFFNKRAQELVSSHLSFGLTKCILSLKRKLKLKTSHRSLIEEVLDLVGYAAFTSCAIEKILKEYDKVHYSRKGQTFKIQDQTMQIELLKSPWMLELMALRFNVGRKRNESKTASYVEFLLHRDDEDDTPSFRVKLPNSTEFHIDLTCPICLETVFDPVSLACSHVLCRMCACSVASVTIFQELHEASSAKKCPICRQSGVFGGSVQLDELSLLLSKSMPVYWKGRLLSERQEQIRQAKEFWWEPEFCSFLEQD